MSVNTKKGPIFDPGMCRGCGALKKCRLLNVEYEWLGQKEVYSDMFLDTLGLVLSHLDGDESERVICATCVLRLRDATAFRRQVLECEERLLQRSLRADHNAGPGVDEIKEEKDTAASSHENIIKDDNFINDDNFVKDDNIVTDDNIDNDDNIINNDELIINQNDACDKNEDPENTHISKEVNDENAALSTYCTQKEKKPKTKKTKKKKTDEKIKKQRLKGWIDDVVAIHSKQMERRKDIRRIDPENTHVSKEANHENAALSTYCTQIEKKSKTKKIKKKQTVEKIKKRRLKGWIDDVVAIHSKQTERRKDVRQIDTIERRDEIRQITLCQKQCLANTITIIQNSYVCPFDTSFSDYHCFYCKQIFTDPDKLRDHNLTHNPVTFEDTLANVYSKKTLQIDITRVDCRLCSANITDIDQFQKHISEAHGMQLYKVENGFLKFKLTTNNLSCIECGTTFSFFHALKKHMAEHFGSCTCDVCGACYFNERMLWLHKKSHEKVDEDFPCSECGKVFKHKQTRGMHEKKIHKKEPTYHCPKCDMIFFSYNLRYRHLIDAHGEQRLFRCDHCDKAYDSRKSLREHNRRVHVRTYLHQCDLCDRRFYLPSRLREHMSTHTGERNFRCDYCGKSYPRLRGLKVHMQSHSSDKRYKCNMCTASFTQNAKLKNHVRKQHQTVDEGFQETLNVG